MAAKVQMRVGMFGTKMWEFNDGFNRFCHRVDGPAVEHPDGTKEWWLNGKRHRIDGPAIEYPDGSNSWYLNGLLHRLDGPAFEGPDGCKAWYINGDLHRLDGPAVEDNKNNIDHYYIKNQLYSKKEFIAHLEQNADEYGIIP